MLDCLRVLVWTALVVATHEVDVDAMGGMQGAGCRD